MATPTCSTLTLPDGTTLCDLSFFDPSPSHNSGHSHNASARSMEDSMVQQYSLTYLAPILLSKIPLYMAISPPLDLLPNTSAEKWLRKSIFDAGMALIKDGGGLLNDAVREVGVLARVVSHGVGTVMGGAEEHRDEIGNGEGRGNGEEIWPATEVVFFRPGCDDGGGDDDEGQCNVRAMALSSHLLYAAASLPPPPRTPADEDEAEDGDRAIEARFLELPSIAQNSVSLPRQAGDGMERGLEETACLKRNCQDIDQLFESAAERRKKARRKGGGGIGLVASRGSNELSNNPKGPNPNSSSSSSSTVNVLQGRHRRRSSLQAMQSPHSQHEADPRPTAATRPSSKAGPPPRQRSSLSRMTSANELALENEASFSERNRSAISKTVMAGMRIFGLHRSAPYASDSQQRGLSFEEGQNAGDGGTNEDEYKLVYHQTFKGTVFAFRKELEKEVLRPDAVREVVDRLLGLFCGEAG